MLINVLAALAVAGATVHGSIRAEGTLEPVPFAQVTLPELDRSTTADERGRFALHDVPAGAWRMEVAAIGYARATAMVHVPDQRAVEAHVLLTPQPLAMTPITVRALRSAPHAGGSATGAGPAPVRMDLAAIEAAPGLVQSDVFRALQTLPSIAPLSDFSTGLYVRGGAADQTLVTLDGVPLFNPYRLGGLFSVVDPGIVSHVEVVAGGGSAALGDRLGGSIAVRSRDGAADRLHGWGEVSMISARAGFDGPVGPGRLLAAGRTNYLGALVSPFIDGFGYGATDVYVKGTRAVGPRTELTASAFADIETLHRSGELDGVRTRWGSALGSVGVHHMSPGGARGHARVAWSSFRGTLSEEGDATGTLETGISDLIVTVGGIAPIGNHTLSAGAQLDAYRLHHTIEIRRGESFSAWSPDTHPFESFEHASRPLSVAAWLEDEWRPLSELRLRLGVRALHSPDHGTAVLPRAGATWRPMASLALSIAGGRYAQVHYGSRDDEALWANLIAFDLPVALAPGQGQSRSSDVVAGVEWGHGATHVRADAYRRWIGRMPVRSLHRRHPPPLLSEAEAVGSADAAGLELSLAHGLRRGSLSTAYTLAGVQHQVDGESYAPRYDRRHSLQVAGELTPTPRTQLGARVVAASGQPYTPIVGVIHPVRADHAWQSLRPVGYSPALLGEHNSARMPGYFRVDASLRHQLVRQWFGRPTTITPFAQVLNVLNTRNALIDAPRTGDPVASVARVPQLPILPTVGVTWRF